MVLGAPIVRGNQPVARVSAHHLRRPHPYPHFPFHRSMYTTFYSYITVRSLSLSLVRREIYPSIKPIPLITKPDELSSRVRTDRERGREKTGKGRGKAKERRVNKGNEGKFIYSLGSALRSSVKQKGLFSRDSSLSWHRRGGGGGGERGKNGAQSRRKRMNERRWAGARFNRNGKRSKSWQIFTFEVYKNHPVFRSSLSRIFYNVVRIVIFALSV